MKNIPFNKPYITPGATTHIQDVLRRGKLSGDGPMCKWVEEDLKRRYGIPHLLLTTSCTHALEMSMLLLDLKPGDEVIMPGFTFVSTANAVIRAGGKPVFCDIEDRTCTLDVDDFSRKITPRTRAVVPVHYAGVAADMARVTDIAERKGITVVEDAAQGVNASVGGRWLGTIGAMGAYSFHDTKNFVMGEGGAFLTSDERIARRAEMIREKGTNRSNFLRGEVDRYTWVDIGSSYVQSELLAAVLRSQLENLDEIQRERKRVYGQYMIALADLAKGECLKLPTIPPSCGSNYHIFHILLRTEDERNRALAGLKAAGVGATFHYVPLHASPYAVEHLGTGGQKLPVVERVSATLLRLPIYPELDDESVAYVAEQLHRILR